MAACASVPTTSHQSPLLYTGVLTHLAATIPHILGVIVGGLKALSRGVDPAQLLAVVSDKQLSCIKEEQNKN